MICRGSIDGFLCEMRKVRAGYDYTSVVSIGGCTGSTAPGAQPGRLERFEIVA